MSIELGKFNQLEVVKEVDFGVYLDGGRQTNRPGKKYRKEALWDGSGNAG